MFRNYKNDDAILFKIKIKELNIGHYKELTY